MVCSSTIENLLVTAFLIIIIIIIFLLSTNCIFFSLEILRVIDSLQLTTDTKLVTPVNWRVGEDVIVRMLLGYVFLYRLILCL